MYFPRAVDKIAAIGLMCLSILSCGDKRRESPVVARVDAATLTLDDVKDRIPVNSELELSPIQIEQLVNRWIEMELIYQEASRRGMNKIPEVKKRMRELNREYLVAYFIDLYIDQELTVSDEEIEAFYDEHADEFIRPDDQYEVQALVAENYSLANAIRTRLLNGEAFASVAGDSAIKPDNEQWGELGWVALNDMPAFFERVVPNMTLNVPSRPQRTEIGYFILLVKNSRKKGEIQELAELDEEIVWRLKAGKREDKYRRIVGLLRENANLEMNIEHIKLGSAQEASADGE